MTTRTVVARAEDGSEVLVTIYLSTGIGGILAAEVEVATRPEVGAIWGSPLEVVEDGVS